MGVRRWPFLSTVPQVFSSQDQRVALERAGRGLSLRASVRTHTTPAVTDIGGGSVCLQFEECNERVEVQDGGYLFGLRPCGSKSFLPVVAGVPGRQGLDRYGQSRIGLAECMVMARPLQGGKDLTFLHDAALQPWLPVNSKVDVVMLARLTDFFLGLNAGTWLQIRILDITAAACAWTQAISGQIEPSSADCECILQGSGLASSNVVEAPVSNNSEWWNYWGGGGNTGGSGQVTLPTEFVNEKMEQFSFAHKNVKVE